MYVNYINFKETYLDSINLDTLGNYSQPQRYSNTHLATEQPYCDPFKHDPFKVKSYRFHYAEPPVPTLHCTNFNLSSPTRAETRMPSSTFHESRRRQFLQTSSGFNRDLKTNYQDEPYTRNFSGNYQRNYGYNSAPNEVHFKNNKPANVTKCNYNFGGVSKLNNVSPRSNTPLGTHSLQRNPSRSSICEINIKIHRTPSNLSRDNIFINIATDNNGPITTQNVPNGSTEQTSEYKRERHPQPIDCELFTSSDSDDESEPIRPTIERMPKFIPSRIKTDPPLNNKTAVKACKAPVKTKCVPVLDVPWVLGTKLQRENVPPVNLTHSAHTIFNNLNSSHNLNKSKLCLQNNSKSSLCSNLKMRNSLHVIKSPDACSIVSKRESLLRLRPSASRTTNNSPVHLNITLFTDQSPNSPT